MNNDLLERIAQTFEKRLKNLNIKATSYEDVNDYAVALGEILLLLLICILQKIQQVL